jgi:hypothetical protein
VGGLAGLYTQDYDLIGVPFMMKSEPLRSADTWFDLIKKRLLENGALGSEYQIRPSILL